MTAPRPTDDIREIAELYFYDDKTDQPVNAGYHRLLDLAAAVAAVERERDEARRVGRLDGQEANNLLVWAEGAEERVNAALARAVAAEARLAAVEARGQRATSLDVLFDVLLEAQYGGGSSGAEERESVAQLAELVQPLLRAALAAPSLQSDEQQS